jgi:hypothetical protein
MSEWISIKERLPPFYEYVLVYGQKKGNEPSPMSIARQFKGCWEMLSDEDQSNAVACGDLAWGMDTDDITHWIPLPNAPIEYYETHGSVLEDNELFPNGFPYEKYGIDRP